MTGFDIWNELGNTYFKGGAYDEAIEAYRKAIELNPKFGWAYSNLALAYTRKGRFAEAVALYQKGIGLLGDPVDKAVSWNRLGDAYRQLNEYDNAAAAYEAADRLSPNRAAAEKPAPGMPARDESARQPLAQARAVLESLPPAGRPGEIDLKNAHIWNELGNIFIKSGAYDDAIEACQKAIRLDAGFAWPYSNLGLALANKGQFAEAIPLYKKSIELFSDNKDKAASWDRLGDAYRRLNVYKDAIAAYEIAKKLTQENEAPGSELREVEIESVQLRAAQARIRAGVDELAESVRMHGIIQPLIVCPAEEPGRYLLIAGRRRLEAARQAGLATVPVIVRQASERQALELALNENLHQAEANPLDVAGIYQRLQHDFGMPEDEIAASVGKTRYMVANNLRLQELPEDVKQAIACKRISEIQARQLLMLPSPDLQSTALQYVLRNELSIQQTEDLIRRMSSRRAAAAAPENEEPEYARESAPPAPRAEGYQPEEAPLLTRTRFILMSNPRVERKSQLVSS